MKRRCVVCIQHKSLLSHCKSQKNLALGKTYFLAFSTKSQKRVVQYDKYLDALVRDFCTNFICFIFTHVNKKVKAMVLNLSPGVF